MSRHNREGLLRTLEAVSPGLAIKEAVEQSSCFVFRDGLVITFNDEIACSMPLDIGFEGAVAAQPLLDLLNKMVEEEISLEPKGPELIVKGKRKRAGITFEADIALPSGAVEPPEKWVEIDAEAFSDAISVVQHCASKDQNNFALTCIHIMPEHVEACDNMQIARYPVATGVQECLVKRDSAKHLIGLGMTEVSETRTWIHYRNDAELVFSLRREVHDYQSLDKILGVEGIPTTLPGGLADAVDKAQVFSSENADNDVVEVTLKNNEIRIKGKGGSGWFEERKDVKWDGEPVEFNIDPKLLLEILGRTNDCQISPGLLKIVGGKFVYVTCLGKV